jgi:predicted DNA binding CopG/RHH family protein
MTMATKITRRSVPKFATETAEAKWWYDQRAMVEDDLIRAIADGSAGRGTASKLARRARASRSVTIRLAETDLRLARKQADQRGLPCQTYIKSVLHQVLTRRERRKIS